jgi:hypothetical protein
MHSLFSLVLLAISLPLVTAQAPGRLLFEPPEGWKTRPAASAMRAAEFILPKVDGDSEDADVVVYYFGGQGGNVDANISRWLGQMQQPDGRASADVARRSSRTVNGIELAILEVPGTYVAEVRPGATEHFNKPGFRMRTVVVPTPRGPYFIKMLGPDKTVQHWSASFDAFLGTLKFQA